MVSLEQVQLLESRVVRAIEYVGKLNAENAALAAEKTSLMSKLDVCQKRIDELEVLVMRFKEEQSRIEDGIISALDRLNQFEEAVERSLRDKQSSGKPQTTAAQSAVSMQNAASAQNAPATPSAKPAAVVKPPEPEEPEPPQEKEVYFEITETEAAEEIDGQDGESAEEKGLDIF